MVTNHENGLGVKSGAALRGSFPVPLPSRV